MNKLLLNTVAMICVMFSMASAVQAQAQASAAGVRILAYGIHLGGNLVYNYKVVNSGTNTVIGFVIGNKFDTDENYSFPQLIRLPLGWSYGITGETGREIILAPGSTSQPLGWQSEVYGQQESGQHYLEWNSSSGDKSVDIYPGQTLAGFTVTVPLADNKLSLPMVTGQPVYTGPDENYIKGSFKATIFDSSMKFGDVWGTIEPADTTPPTLTVTLSPSKLWPPNEKLVPITATITVKDDYDPQPEIQLESITANETLDKDDAKGVLPGTDNRHFMLKAEREGKNKAGRIYTVTYSATDGSGNKTIASATVTVPHDEREHEGRDVKNEKTEGKRDR
jgi:hypothetical protein